MPEPGETSPRPDSAEPAEDGTGPLRRPGAGPPDVDPATTALPTPGTKGTAGTNGAGTNSAGTNSTAPTTELPNTSGHPGAADPVAPLPRRVRGRAQRGTPIPFQAPSDSGPVRPHASPGGAALFEPSTPTTAGFPEQPAAAQIPTLRPLPGSGSRIPQERGPDTPRPPADPRPALRPVQPET